MLLGCLVVSVHYMVSYPFIANLFYNPSTFSGTTL